MTIPLYQRVGWRRHAIYATLKEKPYNFTTNMLSAYSSSLSPFMISKTHISAQKPRRRQLNAKVCGCKSAIFRLYIIICSGVGTDFVLGGPRCIGIEGWIKTTLINKDGIHTYKKLYKLQRLSSFILKLLSKCSIIILYVL